jgi:A/G-specific adenine glycosylase
MPDMSRSAQTPSRISTRLLQWYDAHRRVLPWRALPGAAPDPYRVWLSEIMLQQTTVTAVAEYYREFTTRWPTVEALAAASLDDVRGAWAGLGYYARARNLHRTARIVTETFGGQFPQDAASLGKLPGIGPYTAGAVAAIAFDAREAAVDANAERVIARLFGVEEPMPRNKTLLREIAQSLVPKNRAGDFAQALMDLGASICASGRPRCPDCPLKLSCRGFQLDIAESLPRKQPKRTRPLRRGAAFVAVDRRGAVFLVRRPEKGLLSGMLQPPLGAWAASFPQEDEALKQAPFPARWKRQSGVIKHTFTHFQLEIEVWHARIAGRPDHDGVWMGLQKLAQAPLPTVMRKIIAHALGTRAADLARSFPYGRESSVRSALSASAGAVRRWKPVRH